VRLANARDGFGEIRVRIVAHAHLHEPTLYCDGVPSTPSSWEEDISNGRGDEPGRIRRWSRHWVSSTAKVFDDHAAAERPARAGRAAQIRTEVRFSPC